MPKLPFVVNLVTSESQITSELWALTPAAVLAPKFKAKKTTKTKVVASNFVVYSDSVRRNPAANGVYRGMIAKSYF